MGSLLKLKKYLLRRKAKIVGILYSFGWISDRSQLLKWIGILKSCLKKYYSSFRIDFKKQDCFFIPDSIRNLCFQILCEQNY